MAIGGGGLNEESKVNAPSHLIIDDDQSTAIIDQPQPRKGKYKQYESIKIYSLAEL